MANNRPQTREKRTESSQRMSFLCNPRDDCRLTGCDADQVIRIDVLPDDVLLDIFHFYII